MAGVRTASIAATALAALGVAGGAAWSHGARPDLIVLRLEISVHEVRAGDRLRVTDTVRNRGTEAARGSVVAYYLSRDRVRGPGDRRVGSRAVGRLAPSASSRGSHVVVVPASTPAASFHLLACADAAGQVREASERNNCRVAPGRLVVESRGDRSPPAFVGLVRATTCLPGPAGTGRKSSYHLAWTAATDDVTPSSAILYDVFQATAPGAESFSTPSYTTPPGSTEFSTPPLPESEAHYFVVRARDEAGNRDSNRVERRGVNLCL